MSETLIAPETAAAPERAPVAAETPRRAAHVLRFDRVDRTLHGFLMLSFLGLAFTGMPVLFSTTPWAGRVARLLGGYTVIHRMHRVFATIMIVVFTSFVFTKDPIQKQFGVGLAAAILVDATIVRMILVPATMELLGEWNWWFPKWLDRRVPRINVEGNVLPVGAESPAD